MGQTSSPFNSKDLAHLLSGAKLEIEKEWLRAIKKSIPATQGKDDLYLMNQLPMYLAKVIEILRNPKKEANYHAALKIACEHGENRARSADYTIRDISREYTLLRRILIRKTSGKIPLEPKTVDLIAELGEAGAANSIEAFLRSSLSREFKQRLTLTESQRKKAELRLEKAESAAKAVTTRLEGARADLHAFETDLARLAKALSHAGVAFALISGRDHIFQIVNQRYYALVGCSDLVGQTAANALPVLAGQSLVELLDRVCETGERYEVCEVPIVGEKPHLLNFTYDPFVNGSGEVTGVIAVIVEVTEQVQARRSIEIEQQKFESIFKEAPSALALLKGPRHVFEKANSSCLELVGFRDVLGKPLIQALPELQGQIYLDLLDSVFATGKSVCQKEARILLQRKPDGEVEESYFDLSFIQVRDGRGEPYGVYVHAIDVTDAVQARRQIANSEQRLQLALESAVMGTWNFDLKTGLVVTSPGTNAIFGEPDSNDGLFHVLKRHLHPEESIDFPKCWAEAARQAKPYLHEYRIIRADGAVRWIMSRGTPNHDEAGEPLSLSGVLTDITERKELEQQSLEREAYFQNLVDASPAMLWLTNDQNQCTYLSKQWSIMTGRDLQKDLGEGWLDSVHPEDRPAIDKAFQQFSASRQSFSFAFRLLTGKGVYRWVLDSAKPLFKDDGQFLGYIGVVTDIHDRTLTERKLKDIQERFERSAEATDLGVWYCDLPFETLNWNKEVKNHFFLPPHAEITMDLFYERLHPDDRESIRQGIQFSIDHRTVFDMCYRTVHPGNPAEFKWIRAVGWTDYDAQGTPVRFDGITLDVTAEKSREDELNRAKEAAEAANLSKSSFLANMSHEIRTPLGAIMGFVGLMKQPDLTRQDLESYLTVIDRNSHQLLRLIDDILDLAKVEAGKLAIEKIEFSLIELLADFSSLMGFNARENDISFELTASNALPENVISDPTRLRQILTNVVGNAIKFTHRGRVELAISFKNSKLEFKVTDTGRGISKAQADTLFQPFTQADTSTTRKFGGTGLGLILTRNLCRALGGDFVLSRSALEQGSVFVAQIQVEVPEKSRFIASSRFEFTTGQVLSPTVQDQRFQGKRVLLVEDSPDNQVLVKIILSKMGAEVELASDGFEGVDRALNSSHDIVLMDVQMPRMDGHEATRALRARGYTGSIIALTAHAMKEERARTNASGFTDFLSKPLDRGALIETLERHWNS